MYNLTVGGTHTYFVRAGEDSLWVHNADCGPPNGETEATIRGKDAHRDYDYGPGFQKRGTKLPSGRRPDALNRGTGEVRELKPNTARKIREGKRQLQRYIDELNEVEPREGGWSGEVVTYDP